MPHLWKRYLSMLFVLLATVSSYAQTFHGTISGVVVDSQGAVISDAAVQLTNPATGLTLNTKSSKEGDFIFPELTVGMYQLTVSVGGFQTKKVDNINVEVSKVQNIKVELSVGAESTFIDVTANAIQTDTNSSALVATPAPKVATVGEAAFVTTGLRGIPTPVGACRISNVKPRGRPPPLVRSKSVSADSRSYLLSSMSRLFSIARARASGSER